MKNEASRCLKTNRQPNANRKRFARGSECIFARHDSCNKIETMSMIRHRSFSNSVELLQTSHLASRLAKPSKRERAVGYKRKKETAIEIISS